MHSKSAHNTWLSAFGHMIHRHRLAFLVVPVLICLLGIPLALHSTEDLSTSGWLPSEAESLQVGKQLEEEFGRDTTNHFILFRDPTGQLVATDVEFRQQVAKAVAPLHSDPDISAIYTWGSTGNDKLNQTLISDDRTMSIAVVVMKVGDETPGDSFDEFRELVKSDRLEVRVGGWAATASAFSDLTRSDLIRSEKIALPFTLIMLFIVFGGAIAAGIPVALSLLALIPTFAGVALLSRVTETSLFAVNTVSMLGLALGVDYALIMVSRFREELAQTDAESALVNSMRTAGETILVSGAAVIVGLLGLLSFPIPAATSTALSAGLVVLLSVVLAMTALPAALSLLAPRLRSGPRRLSFRLPSFRWQGAIRQHPLASVLASVACIAVLTLPVLGMRGAASSMTVLPTSQEAREVYDEVGSNFSAATLTPILLVVTPTSGRMTSTTNLNNLLEFQLKLEGLDGVKGTQSVLSFLPIGVTSSVISTSMLASQDVRDASRPYLTDNAAVIEVAPANGPSDETTMDLVRLLRADAYSLSNGAFRVQIGAEVGTNVDMVDYVQQRAPITIAVIIVLMWIALFIRFRSIVIPTKAVLLNLLSLGASFGALVWIFQDGHLHKWLGFEPLGFTILLVPIIMFCFMFGLSMDYEVVMLSRIKEVWDETGDNDEAIDRGLRASAGLVTSAALIMLVVFIAFGTSDLQFIKQVGVGLGLAVLIDTTLIRLVLLPSTMRLFGRWNWWSPWSRQ